MTEHAAWSRRAFLAWAGGGALTAAAAGWSPARAWGGRPVDGNPFALGVASGDPTPDGIVLWTRLAPKPLDPAGGMPARKVPFKWEIAADERFRRVVRRGASTATPELAHSVHVEADGLAPDREYFFRFAAAGELSPIGRTRTAPAAHASRIDFAFVSCQNYQDGYYTAFRHLAGEDVAFVVHLGDSIYEDGPSDDGPRRHDATDEPIALDEYRRRHALYRTDDDLQLVCATHPFIVTFDDHEVDNDWGGDVPQDPEKQSPQAWAARRAAAFQAYWEHMPLRRNAIPRGDSIPVYRRLRFGGLLEVNVLDTRQFRSRSEPCGYGTGPACPEVFDPARTMLGDAQEHWLLDGLRRQARLRRSGLGDDRQRADRDLDLLRRRGRRGQRRRRDRAAREPAHPLSQQQARLRALQRDAGSLASGLPRAGLRLAAGRAAGNARDVRRAGRARGAVRA